MHLVRKSCHALGVAKPHLEQRAVPKRGKPRHRPVEIAGPNIGALQRCPRLLDRAKMKQRNGEQTEQRDLRIDQEFSRPHVQPLGKREPAFEPCAGRSRSPLKLIDLPVHRARGR